MTAIRPLDASWGLPPEVSESIEAMSRWDAGEDTSVTLGDRQSALVGQINRAAEEASVDNWDGEGGQPVSWSTVEFAYKFAEALPVTLPTPDVIPENDGELAFEWYYAPRRVFSVSVRRDGTLSYAGLNGPLRFAASTVLHAGVPAHIIEFVARIASGAE